MKRTAFRKIGKPLKRTKMRRVSKQPISLLKRKLWAVFSAYIKKRDNYTCFTCGAKVESHNCHAGHFIPKSVGGVALYFHPGNVHVQCARCNIWLGGHQWEYGQRLGPEKVAELQALKNLPPQKWDAERYEWEINWYKQLLSELQ